MEKDHLRDAAAERVPDHVRAPDASSPEPARQDACVPLQLVGRVWPAGQTVPREVGNEHATIDCKTRSQLSPAPVAIVEAVQEHERRLARGFAELGPVQPDTFDLGEVVAPGGRRRSIEARARERRGSLRKAASIEGLHVGHHCMDQATRTDEPARG